ncbi:RNA-binding S4 domain-containing protein [Ammoniphilus sp. CFH 90114]|uniref:RNA-binding S4 domain-containing protein n=1 Tax=Ammoniphilus sp. CFH 90114 TaxID=2493665 RepID=UPI00100FBF5F|nr:RNA-binding S4 domain-containing protein [Ammoniphilus sp. CFH 90114]RXT09134.1 RNA-binding S4 domain-containing protein [Ammoniphilus sp. CFH 90114]
MRLDKFLKVSRLVKRRTMAKEVCDQGRVQLNQRQAKSSSTVKVGDELAIRYGNRLVTVTIERIVDSTKKEEAATMYTLVSEERLNQEEPKIDPDYPW